MTRVVPFLALLGLLCMPPTVEAKEGLQPYNAAKSAFKKAFRSKDPKERARAFRFLQDRPEVEAIGEILWGFGKVQTEADKIRKEQLKAIAAFNKGAAKMAKAKEKFRKGQQSPKDIESFNKSTRKIEKEMGKAERERKAFEIAWLRETALLDSATTTLATVFRALGEGAMPNGLGLLREYWLGEKSTPETHLRWMETLVDVNRPEVSAEFHRVLDLGAASLSVRVAALEALAMRRDGKALGRCIDLLKISIDNRTLIAGAIHGLKVFHDKRGIVPLISFLRREKIGRLQGDAHAALKSLTGQKHGPYADPWLKWWKDSEKTFKMPPEPIVLPPGKAQEESGTFYGIRSFSDRVLYVIDISASMEWALGGRRGEPGGSKAKMVTARKELIGAVYNLPVDANFNVILFNHEVIKWSPGVVKVSPATQKKCERWVEKVNPTGLTNIHDALESAFRMVFRTTGEPDFDTIFFLTDGKPTAGKIRNTQEILERVKEWVAVSQTQIHVIAIGDSEDLDEKFLKELAVIGRGEFVRRGS